MQPAGNDPYLKLLPDSEMQDRQSSYANIENHRPRLKRLPDFDRPDRDDNDKRYYGPAIISQKTRNVVFGSQLLNACKQGNSKKAHKALSKITSYSSFQVKDQHNNTAFYYAITTKMIAIANEIHSKMDEYYYIALQKGDFTTMEDIKNLLSSNEPS